MASTKMTTTTKRSTLPLPSGKSEERRYTWENADTFESAQEMFMRWRDHVSERPSAQERRKRNLLYASIYSNMPMLGFGTNSYTRTHSQHGRIALNATQNAIDSLSSKICKNPPRPMFTTVEGDWDLREKVENADKYVDGSFMKMGYYDRIYPAKVLDSCIWGLGVTKRQIVDGKACIERTFPFELIVDERECMYGDPVRMGQRKWLDKQVVWDRYRKEGNGKAEKEWNQDLENAVSAAGGDDDDDFDRDDSSDQIPVYEGWRNPTSRSPGKLIECIRGKTLKFEDFGGCINDVFSFLRLEVQPMGFYGIGICERVASIQGEINRIIRDIQMAMHLMAKPHWMVESSSNVNTASLNNDIATIIKYTGAVKPEVYTPQSMSGEVFQHLQYLVKTLYEVTGISQLSAQSQKPAGLDSGIALRTYLNVETERFSNFLRNAEKSASDDAMAYAKLLSSTKPPKVMASRPYERSGPMITWSKLDFDSIAVQVYPTSKLPDTPAGKREYALELAQYTQITKDEIYEMLEWGDTEAFAAERLAGRKNLRRAISKLRKGEKVMRGPIGDHEAAYPILLDAYEQAEHDECPTQSLANFRAYIKQTYRYMTGKTWTPGSFPWRRWSRGSTRSRTGGSSRPTAPPTARRSSPHAATSPCTGTGATRSSHGRTTGAPCAPR